MNNYMAKERAFYCLNEQFVLNITGDMIFFHKVFRTLWKLINCQIEVWFTNKNLLSVNARPNCRKNKQLILSNDTCLFYNKSFLLKSREKDCMTIDVDQVYLYGQMKFRNLICYLRILCIWSFGISFWHFGLKLCFCH